MTEPRRTEPARARHVPERTCAGCRAVDQRDALVRVVLLPEGDVFVDLAGKAAGRGAWLHPRAACVMAAAKRGLARSFKAPLRLEPSVLAERLREAAERRIPGLIAAARGARRAVVGGDAVAAALAARQARLVLVATDARAAAETEPVRRAIASGIGVAWGTKARLGAALGRGDTGVLAATDDGFARALGHAVAISHLSVDTPGSAGAGAEGSTEVR